MNGSRDESTRRWADWSPEERARKAKGFERQVEEQDLHSWRMALGDGVAELYHAFLMHPGVREPSPAVAEKARWLSVVHSVLKESITHGCYRGLEQPVTADEVDAVASLIKDFLPGLYPTFRSDGEMRLYVGCTDLVDNGKGGASDAEGLNGRLIEGAVERLTEKYKYTEADWGRSRLLVGEDAHIIVTSFPIERRRRMCYGIAGRIVYNACSYDDFPRLIGSDGICPMINVRVPVNGFYKSMRER